MRERLVLGGPVGQWLDDALLAALVGVAEVGGSYLLAEHRDCPIDAAGYGLLAAGSAVLVLRRRFPVSVLAAAYALTFAFLASERHGGLVWLAAAAGRPDGAGATACRQETVTPALLLTQAGRKVSIVAVALG